jgi:hypothetical protein
MSTNPTDKSRYIRQSRCQDAGSAAEGRGHHRQCDRHRDDGQRPEVRGQCRRCGDRRRDGAGGGRAVHDQSCRAGHDALLRGEDRQDPPARQHRRPSLGPAAVPHRCRPAPAAMPLIRRRRSSPASCRASRRSTPGSRPEPWSELCEDAVRWAEEPAMSSRPSNMASNLFGEKFITYFPEGRDFYQPAAISPMSGRSSYPAGHGRDAARRARPRRRLYDHRPVGGGLRQEGQRSRLEGPLDHMTETPPRWVEPLALPAQ